MAKIIPEKNWSFGTLGDQAEIAVVEMLSTLPDDFTVIRNVVLCSRFQTQRAELDIAVVTPTGGLVILEVKAGALATNDEGQVLRHYGNNCRDVGAQLESQAFLLKRRMAEIDGVVPLKHYLVIPDGYLEGGCVSLSNAFIIDADNIHTLCDRIRRFNNHCGQTKDLAGAEKIVDFMLNKYTIMCDPRSYTKALKASTTHNCEGLAQWVPLIESPLPVVEVAAPAGAGKTKLAIRLIRMSLDSGKRAAYLNFSRNIVEWMLKTQPIQNAHFIGTWHELAWEMGGEPDMSALSSEQRNERWQNLTDELCRMLENGRREWDTIVVDDAQDFKAEWIQALSGALSPTGTMYILSDPRLTMHSDRGNFQIDEAVHLHTNVSQRIPISQIKDIRQLGLTTLPLETRAVWVGQRATVKIFDSPDDLIKKTRDAITSALNDGYTAEQIAVLSWHGLEKSEILKGGTIGPYTIRRPTDAFDDNNNRIFTEGEIFADTLQRFKGLHKPAIIVTEIDFNELGQREKALLYLALTRCSMRIYLVPSNAACLTLIKQSETITAG